MGSALFMYVSKRQVEQRFCWFLILDKYAKFKAKDRGATTSTQSGFEYPNLNLSSKVRLAAPPCNLI